MRARSARSRLSLTLIASAGAVLFFACSGADRPFTAANGGTGAAGAGAGSSGAGRAGEDGGASTSGSGGIAGGGQGNSAAGQGGDDAGEGGAPTAGQGGGGGHGASAGSADAGEGGACAQAWFPDGDGDERGRTSGKVIACSPPDEGAWAEQGGDCNDDNSAVSPDRQDYAAEPYMTSGGEESFDYDCSGSEISDPSQVGAAPTCPETVLGCSGWGYLGTDRSGPGVNPLCGSTATRTCVSNGIDCTAVVGVISEAHRCR